MHSGCHRMYYTKSFSSSMFAHLFFNDSGGKTISLLAYIHYQNYHAHGYLWTGTQYYYVVMLCIIPLTLKLKGY